MVGSPFSSGSAPSRSFFVLLCCFYFSTTTVADIYGGSRQVGSIVRAENSGGGRRSENLCICDLLSDLSESKHSSFIFPIFVQDFVNRSWQVRAQFRQRVWQEQIEAGADKYPAPYPNSATTLVGADKPDCSDFWARVGRGEGERKRGSGDDDAGSCGGGGVEESSARQGAVAEYFSYPESGSLPQSPSLFVLLVEEEPEKEEHGEGEGNEDALISSPWGQASVEIQTAASEEASKDGVGAEHFLLHDFRSFTSPTYHLLWLALDIEDEQRQTSMEHQLFDSFLTSGARFPTYIFDPTFLHFPLLFFPCLNMITCNFDISIPSLQSLCHLNAEAAGLPHLNPFLDKKLDHSKGANFAVAGVGVLSKELRAKWNITLPYSQRSVDVQFQWLEQLMDLHKFKDENARRNHLKTSLFLLGGGINDYNNMKGGNYSRLPFVEQKIAVMPDIMAAINTYVKKLIVGYGATKVVVFGIYQGGNDHNATNYFHALHNQRLQDELQKLREEFPHVRLVYGDLWGAVQSLLDNYSTLGYKHPINEICCGDWTVYCASSPSVSYCRNPNEYWFWDSMMHFTSFTHRLLSAKIIPQISAALGCGKM
ncbi:unnamed protein product [Linum tenue]|uniref:GDSL esterase/lipase n=1 Tax=Linum tenue TaxID=586396 RepID=A0AAV0GQN5_9ROSI|nr:unnamed protein product [Linum tenue]